MTKTCPDEENFAEMYEALGNYKAQEQVRILHPKASHCELLLVNATACSNCKKNPHRDSSDEEKKGFMWDDEVQAIYRIVSMYDYGMLNQLDQISPAEAICLRIVDKFEKAQQLSHGAMSALFGGK